MIFPWTTGNSDSECGGTMAIIPLDSEALT